MRNEIRDLIGIFFTGEGEIRLLIFRLESTVIIEKTYVLLFIQNFILSVRMRAIHSKWLDISYLLLGNTIQNLYYGYVSRCKALHNIILYFYIIYLQTISDIGIHIYYYLYVYTRHCVYARSDIFKVNNCSCTIISRSVLSEHSKKQ